MRPNSLPVPLPSTIAGPVNYINADYGESVTAVIGGSDGFVRNLSVYLVNQANLNGINERNKKAHSEKTA